MRVCVVGALGIPTTMSFWETELLMRTFQLSYHITVLHTLPLGQSHMAALPSSVELSLASSVRVVPLLRDHPQKSCDWNGLDVFGLCGSCLL